MRNRETCNYRIRKKIMREMFRIKGVKLGGEKDN